MNELNWSKVIYVRSTEIQPTRQISSFKPHLGRKSPRIFAAAASEPEASERGSSLISRRLHYRGLQSLFLTKRKELWLCANGRFRMRSGMRMELWLCANGNILGCAVI